MNAEEDFEQKLRALTSRLARPDPTPAWKPDILARAARERDAQTPRAPRWFLASLGTAWVCIGILRLSTPRADGIGHDFTVGAPAASGPAHASRHEATDTPWKTIIALNANPDFPDLP
jgi:hypothetical protein